MEVMAGTCIQCGKGSSEVNFDPHSKICRWCWFKNLVYERSFMPKIVTLRDNILTEWNW